MFLYNDKLLLNVLCHAVYDLKFIVTLSLVFICTGSRISETCGLVSMI